MSRPAAPVALILAHPGHELFAYGWLEELRPTVHVLTDGSGRSAGARIAGTAGLLSSGLGQPGRCFGDWTDLQLYERLRDGDFGPFLQVARGLREALLGEGIRTLVSDAFEGRILMHDVVALLASAVARSLPGVVDHLELPIYCWPPGTGPPGRVRFAKTLSDDQLRRKIDAARSTPSEELRAEVESFLAHRTPEGLRREHLLQARLPSLEDLPTMPAPAWQQHGEELARKGVYPKAIRVVEHLVPLVRAFDQAALTAAGKTCGS